MEEDGGRGEVEVHVTLSSQTVVDHVKGWRGRGTVGGVLKIFHAIVI